MRVAEVRVNDNERLIGIMEDNSRRLKKLENPGTQKKHFNNKQQTDNRNHRTSNKQTFLPNANARPFTPHIAKTSNNGDNNEQNVFPTNQPAPRPTAPPPKLPQNSTAQPTAMDDALICYYHQRFDDKACLCREPCVSASSCLIQSKVTTLVAGEPNETILLKLSPSRLLYVADKLNRCSYLIDTGAAVSVLPQSCANGTVDSDSLPLVAANNLTITTYGTSNCLVDVGLRREYSLTFIVADVKQPILGADFFIHYNLLVDLSDRCLQDM